MFLVVGVASAVTPPPVIALEPFVSGLSSPIDFQIAKDGTGRIFVVEQGGTIRIIKNKKVLAKPFLNITSLVVSGGEEGLLGLAFHPSYKTNGRFFVNYTRMVGTQIQTVIAEYHQSAANRDVADPTGRILLTVNQPFDNHKGGQLAFGPGRIFLHWTRRRWRHRGSI
jgi:glucose/arabinose dehydrogenase